MSDPKPSTQIPFGRDAARNGTRVPRALLRPSADKLDDNQLKLAVRQVEVIGDATS